jgi:hypothetical protein
MKKLLLIAVMLAAAYYGAVQTGHVPVPGDRPAASPGSGEQLLASAYANQRSNVQVQAGGRVVRILPDDDRGSRHQRFVVELPGGQTVLVAHNIDLARRVAGLSAGDFVEFNGEYEWNPEGGVIHWTHADPQRRHVPGWVRHEGRTYQ